MNSHRYNVEEAIAELLNGVATSFIGITEEQVPEATTELADTVFDALGITRDEQDKVGGYFKVFLGEKIPELWGYICFKCKEIKHRAEVTRCVVPEDSGEFTSAMNTSRGYSGVGYENLDAINPAENAENEYTRRIKELADGAKYTKEEFKSYAVGRVTGGTPCNWYINLQTPIAGYSQMYSGTYTLKEAKSLFFGYYYPMYLADYERSTAVDEMDEE